MSFVKNQSYQININDSINKLTERERKFLSKTWAQEFADEIFPAIPEHNFSVIYSENPASRPNTPANIVFGALILKELHEQTDSEILESVMFDIRYQVALHTTSYDESPINDRTLSRFRERCLAYETETGIDLIKETVNGLSGKIAKLMKIKPGIKRMDSLMIESNIKKMSRLELLYTCVANIVKMLSAKNEPVPPGMERYINPDDANKVIYHERGNTVESKIKTVLTDAAVLIKMHGDKYRQEDAYKNLTRALYEQTTQTAEGEYALKEKTDPTMNSTMLQNPADPDATYRAKNGEQHVGYVSNIIEDVSDGRSVISDYEYDQNVQSDSNFIKNAINELGYQEKPLTIVADGAYGGECNVRLADENNIILVATDMQGKKPDEVYAGFVFDESNEKLERCAGGQKPATNRYYPRTGQCRVTFDKAICEQCLYKQRCKPKFYKTKASLLLSYKTVLRAKQLMNMKTDAFKVIARLRNGVESIPSVLRRRYRVDEMPVRGKLRTKLFFGFKIAAINIKKLIKYRNDLALGCV